MLLFSKQFTVERERDTIFVTIGRSLDRAVLYSNILSVQYMG